MPKGGLSSSPVSAGQMPSPNMATKMNDRSVLASTLARCTTAVALYRDAGQVRATSRCLIENRLLKPSSRARSPSSTTPIATSFGAVHKKPRTAMGRSVLDATVVQTAAQNLARKLELAPEIARISDRPDLRNARSKFSPCAFGTEFPSSPHACIARSSRLLRRYASLG